MGKLIILDSSNNTFDVVQEGQTSFNAPPYSVGDDKRKLASVDYVKNNPGPKGNTGPTGASGVPLSGYTVATLPANGVGKMAYVTDALTPTSLSIVSGGGAVIVPVFNNGTNWIVL